MASDRWLRIALTARRLGLALSLLAAPALVSPVLAQGPPPPKKTKKAPKKEAPAQKSGGGSAAPAAAPQPVLLVQSDMNCTVTIDGEKATRVPANDPTRITVSAGDHILKAVSEDGRELSQVVKAQGGGQTAIQLALASIPVSTRPEHFDKAVADVWLGLSDLAVAGSYADSILNKSWGFQNKDLSTAVHSANTYLQRQVEDFKKFNAGDPARKRVQDDFVRLAGDATKYVEMLTQSISAAQQANSWSGQPADLYSQAKALGNTLTVPDESLDVLKKSKAFQAALPPDRRVRLGFPPDPRDVSLGADYYQSTPNMLAVVTKGGLADKFGLRAGDRLISAAGRAVPSVWDFKLILRENAGRKINVELEREGKRQGKDMSVPSQLP